MRWISLLASALALLAVVALERDGLAAPSEGSLELRNLGIGQLENEQPADAEATFRRLARAEPKEPLGHANLAIALLRQQKTDEALESIDRALALAPGRGDLLAIKADTLRWAGRPVEALALYESAADAAPEDLEILFGFYNHATTVQGEAGERAAGKALGRLIRLRPENALLLLRAGARAVADGDRAEASRVYLRLRELLWQAPEIATTTLDRLLEALKADDLSGARVPSLRLENVLKITPMVQQGRRELTTDILGVPVLRFRDEPPVRDFGPSVPVRFETSSLSGAPTAGSALIVGDLDGDRKPDLARILGGFSGKLELRRAANELKAELPGLVAPPGTTGLTAADLDNDGHLDLLAAGGEALAVWRGDGAGGFTDATAAIGLAGRKAKAVAFFDYDIEGDLDLFTLGAGGADLWRNALDGPLEAVGDRALPEGLDGLDGAVATDLDRDGDLDLLLGGQGVAWLDNLRQGVFSPRSRQAGLSGVKGRWAATSADLDRDGAPEILLAGEAGLKILTRDGGRSDGRFEDWPGAFARRGPARAVHPFDADNDGRLDLAVAGPDGVSVLIQQSDGSFEALALEAKTGAADALASADLDGDGDLDLIAATRRGLLRLTNQGGNANAWLSVRLRGLDKGNSKNNLLGLGSTLEVFAGDAYQFLEMRADVAHFGLGKRQRPDLLRIVWTNGVPQNRIQPQGSQTVVEEQVLKGSCPFLYVWDGEGVRFVTDLLWGAPIGLPAAPGVWVGADPSELVRVDGAAPVGDIYRLLITEELWEAAFFDHTRLWVVDHPADVEVASSLRILDRPVPEAVHGARAPRPVRAAWDGRGAEATERVRSRDAVYADGYDASPYQGVADAWTFTFDLGEAPDGPIRLLLDGWIFPADASLNLAVAQREDLPRVAPRLEVETAEGWRVLMPSMGHPAGKTKTMVVDTPALPAGATKLRIVTSLWLHWDRIAWVPGTEEAPFEVLDRLLPSSARLGFRGFSEVVRQAPNAPHDFAYERATASSPWLAFPGRYTRYGEVGELLATPDDRSVILAPGDEMTLLFDAGHLPPVRPGWRRTVFLESHGWDKDADRNTYEAAQVEPLPFRGMSGYPYGPEESFPDTEAHRAYREEWLTREIR